MREKIKALFEIQTIFKDHTKLPGFTTDMFWLSFALVVSHKLLNSDDPVIESN